MRNVTNNVNTRQLLDKPLWIGTNSTTPTNLNKLIANQTPIDSNFIEKINASGISTNDLSRILKSAGLKSEEISILLSEIENGHSKNSSTPDGKPASEGNNGGSSRDLLDPLLPYSASQTGNTTNSIITSRSLPAWRGAEQYVSILLSDHGYEVEDCSRQNLGYDLLAQKDERKYYIEVKLIDYAGQPFIITTNEETVAREHGNYYIIALTLRDSSNSVHVQFINDPVQALKFVRQCRQWVWECSEYEFNRSTKNTHL